LFCKILTTTRRFSACPSAVFIVTYPRLAAGSALSRTAGPCSAAPSSETPSIPPDVGLQTNLRALGVTLVRDSRPNRFYPIKGTAIDFTGDFFANGLGSKYSFHSYNFTFNKYASLFCSVSRKNVPNIGD
jgi:outer membrane protein assembly factor BamA